MMKMKSVTLTLAALTRVEYTETVEVPETTSDEELGKMLDNLWDETDGGKFYDDPEFWEKGNCYYVIEDHYEIEDED